MSDDPCHCFKCGKAMRNFMAGEGLQPNDGLCFRTYGHYGSTFFDPMDGSFIDIAICDGTERGDLSGLGSLADEDEALRKLYKLCKLYKLHIRHRRAAVGNKSVCRSHSGGY